MRHIVIASCLAGMFVVQGGTVHAEPPQSSARPSGAHPRSISERPAMPPIGKIDPLTLDVSGQTSGGPGTSLSVGLAIDDGSGTLCGSDTTLTVYPGDRINFCYTMTNQSSTTLNNHWLAHYDTGAGSTTYVFENQEYALAPGESRQYNHVVTAAASQAIRVIWLAMDHPDDYAVTPGTYQFIDIRQTGTLLNPRWDDLAHVTLPFEFNFFGLSADFYQLDLLGIAPQGGMSFGSFGAALPWYDNSPLTGGLSTPFLFPYWDDLSDDGDVYWQAMGEAPNRFVVVQWNRGHWNAAGTVSSPGRINFEAILREDGTFTFQYEKMTFEDPQHPEWDHGGSATIGIQGDFGDFVQFSYDDPIVADQSAIDWVYTPRTEYLARTDVGITVVPPPEIGLAPGSIGARANPGDFYLVRELAVTNSGGSDLSWSINEASSSRAHFPRHPVRVPHKLAPDASVLATRSQAPARPASSAPWAVAYDEAFGASGVPAFGFTSWTHFDFVSLDLERPGSLTAVASPWPAIVYAATFVDDDFTKVYVITAAGQFDPIYFGTIDTTNGALTVIREIDPTLGVTFVGMKQDPTTGNLYALGVYDDGSGTHALYAIDRHSGAPTRIGYVTGPDLNPYPALVNLAISPAGLLYAIDIVDDVLIAIDKRNAEAAVIGPTGLDADFAQGMDFDASTGILYWAAYGPVGNSNVFTFDTDTGVSTRVGRVQDNAELFGLSIAKPGPCSRLQDIPWLSVPTSNGVLGPNQRSPLEIMLDPAELGDGVYTANLCVFSNDPRRPRSVVPITFTVGEVAAAGQVQPEILAATVETGGTASMALTLSNSGTPGSRLDYSIFEAADDCSAPADQSWLRASPLQGEVAAAAETSIRIDIDATGLEAETTHAAWLCMVTNDSAHPVFGVPVNLAVTKPNRVFADGFEPRPTLLAYDDGVFDASIGRAGGGQFIWLNRFTPDAAQLPMQLEQVQVYWSSSQSRVGQGNVFDVFVYTDADGDPWNGATLVASVREQQVTTTEDFQAIALPAPIAIDARSGDVLIAIVNRREMDQAQQFPAALDTDEPRFRSYFGIYDGGNPSGAPELPADLYFRTVEDLGIGISGNWMLRGAGTTAAGVPVLLR
ncbi:hypothetical protein [Dokdonella ginsengisoli]|uniref:Uncharacterized protein n=1 Tax=Dokdonella ginsengisoli TaxID=363846 RepID=A0ABV9QQB0_9GAMM